MNKEFKVIPIGKIDDTQVYFLGHYKDGKATFGITLPKTELLEVLEKELDIIEGA